METLEYSMESPQFFLEVFKIYKNKANWIAMAIKETHQLIINIIAKQVAHPKSEVNLL